MVSSQDAALPAKVLLIVDDEFLIRWSLRNRLTQAGYRVLEAASLADARTALRQPIDLVLLDVLLPDGLGVDLLPEVKAAHPQTQVILLSAHASPDMEAQARANGAFDFLHKPFDLEMVTSVVDRAARVSTP